MNCSASRLWRWRRGRGAGGSIEELIVALRFEPFMLHAGRRCRCCRLAPRNAGKRQIVKKSAIKGTDYLENIQISAFFYIVLTGCTAFWRQGSRLLAWPYAG